MQHNMTGSVHFKDSIDLGVFSLLINSWLFHIHLRLGGLSLCQINRLSITFSVVEDSQLG